MLDPLQEVCPRPAGLPAPPANLVTAAQVEKGDATLKEFVLSYRQYEASLRKHAKSFGYIGCILTHEGPWNSGSTYLVTLTRPGGRVDMHGQEVVLSGGRLDPVIWEKIQVAASSSSDGGPFMAEAGTAASYAVGGAITPTGGPAILVAGFDLQEAHLVQEPPNPDDVPAVKASDVVDRDTLKAFVDGALRHVIRPFMTGEGYEGVLRLKRVFRDPDGPWIHGSVYLFVIDENGYVLFHGAFPEKYEFQTPTDTLRDAVTGELILPKIIEAALRSEESGDFVEYHFDDPNDVTDSAEIPKTTYADALIGPAAPGDIVATVTLIVGAGFYRE